MERDEDFNQLTFDDLISTHTLTWSVTILMRVYRIARQISTHTLTWSVTF